MKRRHFLAGAAALALPVALHAQKRARLAILLYGTPETDPTFRSFRAGLKDVGLVEGRDVVFDIRYGQGKPETLPALARELVQGKPDILLAMGGDVAPAARAATSRIPIVISSSSDPVQMKLVASLARPGGNITGVTFVSSDLAPKRLELLREFMPRLSRVGMIWNPEHSDPEYREAARSGAAMGVKVESLEVRRPEDADAALRAALQMRVEAIMPVSSRLLVAMRDPILRFAAERRVPVAAGWGPWAAEGALFTYGPDLDLLTRGIATYVDRILKGAKPAELPVEQPTRFQLMVNARVAKALKLAMPQALVLRADRVIE
jgi:putative ABC transport system substrate-binding protein